MSKVGLFSAMDFAAVPADEFRAWYDGEHIAERRRIPGFLTCERWIGADHPSFSLGTYDLEDEAVLASEAYRLITADNATPWTKSVISLAAPVPYCLAR
jgi:hypothetical protein